MFKRISVLAATLGAVALLGASLAGSAFAQGPADPTNPAQPQAGLGGRWGASQTAGSTQRGPAWGGQATLDAVSKLTGISVADIQAQRLDGKSLLGIANVAKDKLVDAILSAKKAVVDGLVQSDKLTQDQATTMLDNMKERVSAAVERTETGPANGRGNGGNGGNGVCLTDGTATPGAAQNNGAGRMGRSGGMGGFGSRFQTQAAR